MLDLALSWKENHDGEVKERPLGLLKDKYKCVIKDDFEITDEEFFQL